MVETNSSGNKNGSVKKIILILLTVFIVGPLVFVGACLPFGALSLRLGAASGADVFAGILFFCAIIACLVLAVYVVYLIVKSITKNKK